jgi:hypothetical protein
VLAGRLVGFDDGVALGLDGPDQLKQKLQTLELAAFLRRSGRGLPSPVRSSSSRSRRFAFKG